MTYEGNPTYAKLDTLKELLRPWNEQCFVGDEWGEWVSTLWDAADRGCGGIGEDHKVETLLQWVMGEWTRAFEEGFLEDFYDDEIQKAQNEFIKNWEYCVKSHSGYASEREALRQVADSLPAWIKPQPISEDEQRIITPFG